jgi:hypothetical protein
MDRAPRLQVLRAGAVQPPPLLSRLHTRTEHLNAPPPPVCAEGTGMGHCVGDVAKDRTCPVSVRPPLALLLPPCLLSPLFATCNSRGMRPGRACTLRAQTRRGDAPHAPIRHVCRVGAPFPPPRRGFAPPRQHANEECEAAHNRYTPLSSAPCPAHSNRTVRDTPLGPAPV